MAEPKEYKRVKPEPDHFLRTMVVVCVTLSITMVIGFFGFWYQLDKIYGGNPTSGGREILCALARDDALDDELVNKAYTEHCVEAVGPLRP